MTRAVNIFRIFLSNLSRRLNYTYAKQELLNTVSKWTKYAIVSLTDIIIQLWDNCSHFSSRFLFTFIPSLQIATTTSSWISTYLLTCAFRYLCFVILSLWPRKPSSTWNGSRLAFHYCGVAFAGINWIRARRRAAAEHLSKTRTALSEPRWTRRGTFFEIWTRDRCNCWDPYYQWIFIFLVFFVASLFSSVHYYYWSRRRSRERGQVGERARRWFACWSRSKQNNIQARDERSLGKCTNGKYYWNRAIVKTITRGHYCLIQNSEVKLSFRGGSNCIAIRCLTQKDEMESGVEQESETKMIMWPTY